ncbi:MAG: DUF2083 domain-containing protein [Alphaproteobacteria bacterium]|nr:DUF2083 domain-containing protein [Alphaproteobacteria bacterium]
MRAPIGLRIRSQRKSLGLSQAELARRSAISASYLNLIEANKRDVGGTLLRRIADALSLDISELTGDSERRLIMSLEEALTEPVFVGSGLQPGDARALVAQHPQAAEALARLHRAYLEANSSLDTYQQRLRADPLFSQLLHQVLNHVSAVRSSAEIVADTEDLTNSERERFIHAIGREARDVSDVAETLVAHFEQSSAQRRLATPQQELNDFFVAEDTHFPPLEAVAEELRADIETAGTFGEAAIEAMLAARFGVETRRGGAPPDGEASFSSQYRFRPDTQTMWFQGATTAATRQFQLARLFAELVAPEILNDTVASANVSSTAARRLIFRALASYIAGAIVMPYERILESAEANAYDIDHLGQSFTASFEQVAHRLVTLKRKGAEGIPFAFLRSDPAGRLTKHFPLPGLMLPSTGHACPLWALYIAFRQTGQVVRQVARFADGSRYLFIAKTVSKRMATFREQPFFSSVMLATDILHADRTVYAQGLDLQDEANQVPVGPACRLCVRRGCAHRQEEALDLQGAETELRTPLVPRRFDIGGAT